MMNFKKYNSIENSYQEAFINRILQVVDKNVECVVQEKVHGANLSFWTDGIEVKCAKRTEFLNEEDKFFNYQLVLEKYRQAVINVYQKLKSKNSSIEQVVIFGELFGGTYPHKEVKKITDAITVQKGVFYAPYNEFYAFDIRCDENDFVNVLEANKLFEEEGFFYAKPLFQGSLLQALEYSNTFESHLPLWLGLPLIDSNTCEGVVIKVVENVFLPSGSRIVIKNKNEKFTEKTKRKPREAKPEVKLSTEAQNVFESLLMYVTNNRLNNVISKIGEVTMKDLGRVNGMFCKDALEDFKKENEGVLEILEKKEQKIITKSLNNHGAKLVKEYLLKN